MGLPRLFTEPAPRSREAGEVLALCLRPPSGHSRCRLSLLVERYESLDVPPSLPAKPPRRSPRPRPPPTAPSRASDGAVPDASRLPCRTMGLSATLVGGAGSLSESSSLSLPGVDG